MSFRQFNVGDKDDFHFYKLPHRLIKDPAYRDLSSGAKLLMTCMLDRRELSEKNGWADKKGRVFIYYPIHQICKDLSVCKQTAGHILDELEEADLIRRVRQGLGRPTRIYVGRIGKRREEAVCETGHSDPEVVCQTGHSHQEAVYKSGSEKYESHPSEGASIIPQEECKSGSNNTNNTDNEYIYTDSSYGYREPASKEAYEREMPMTREEVLEEYRKMKERGEEDMQLIELMLLATN